MNTPTALLEREEQLAELAALLAAARAGEGSVALVHGEAGIGKTALLRRLAREQATGPTRLLWGGCEALFTPRPLSPLQEVAWEHGGAVAERLREGASRDAIFQTFLEDLRHPRPPALVVFEDVHWADEATLDLLKFLGRRAQRTCALLVISWRDDEVPLKHPLRSVLGDLPREAVRRFPLQGLSPAAVEKLAAAAQRPAAGLHAATAGNPFFVTEVLANDAPRVPATVRDAVLGRVSRLTAAARELLEVASVMPARAELALLAAAAGPAFGALDELLSAGVLTLASDAVSFRHELARRALEDAVAPLHSRALHARVLAWLRALPDDPAQLARLVHHAQRAGDGPAVLELGARAAERADRLGAHRESAAHLAAALQHAAGLEQRGRAELLDSLCAQYFLVDLMQAGLKAGLEALALWRSLGDRLREARCLRRLARIAWYMASSQEARRYGEQAVAALEGLPPSPELAMAWATRAQLHMEAEESAEAIAWGEKALALARAGGYLEALAHALNTVGCARIQQRDPSGWEELEESLRVALAGGLAEGVGRAYANLGEFSIEERRYEQAARWFDEGIAFSEERDLGTVGVCGLSWRAHLRVVTGRWSEAAEDAAQVSGNPLASVLTKVVALNALGLLRARRGDAGAWEALDEALEVARRAGELPRLVPVAAARAELAWLEGDLARTRREAEAVLPAALRSGRAWYVGELALWALRGGASPVSGVPIARPYELQLKGEWRAASAEFARLGSPYEAALACFEGDDPETLKAALAALERMDARPAAACLRRRLAALGARVPRGPQAARRGHPFDLTSREQEVLGALALGLSNGQIGERLFVSAKTIDHHVSSILSKLGVPSRGAAVAAARSHGLLAAVTPGTQRG